MKFRPAIRSLAEIEALIYSNEFQGGWRKRVNHKRKLIAQNNCLVREKIQTVKDEIHRRQKVEAARAQDVRGMWAAITKLELKIIDQ